MHIAEGVLSIPVLTGGAAFTAIGVGLGLRKMDYDRIPTVAVLSSAFFVASLIHVPIGPSSAHLILNGLTGLVLGWAAFPALLVALFLQAVIFGFGGITAIGVNTFNMAFPAVLCYYVYGRAVRRSGGGLTFLWGFMAGASGILLGCVAVGVSLFLTGREFTTVIEAVAVAHVPVMITEGVITGSIVTFLHKVCPELLSEWSASNQEEANNV